MSGEMAKIFKCGVGAKLFRIMGIVFPIAPLLICSFAEPRPGRECDLLITILATVIAFIVAVEFQFSIPLEVKTNSEGMTVRRWKSGKFYPWRDVKILMITKLLWWLGRMDFHLLSEPFYKRRLMIIGLNFRRRKELLAIIREGVNRAQQGTAPKST